MITPNHVYLKVDDNKSKIYVKDLSSADSLQFKINELTLKITNNNNTIVIQLFDDNNELQGIINYE